MSDESDNEEHYYNGSEEDDESQESDSDDANHGLLDLEASEGSSDPESDADQFSDDGSYAEYSFPKFMQLPPEIREMIWGAFCPDLGPEPRVFELHLRTGISPPGAVHLPDVVHSIVAGPQLESQTKPMRAVLAVHRESRALALKPAPNELSLSDGELVHYHEERDVLFVAWTEDILLRGIALRFQELGIEAQNLAFPSDMTTEYGEDLADLMYLLPQTRRLFLLDEEENMQDERISIREYAWTVADMVRKYHLYAEEESDIGFLVPANRIICWPDLDNHRDFAEEHVTDPDADSVLWSQVNEFRHRLRNPLEDSRELNQDDLSDEEKTEAIDRLRSIEVWPMVRFNFLGGLNRFHYIETRARCFPDQMSEPETPPKYIHIRNEYESDGIDDDPFDDSTSTSVDDYDEMLAQNLAQQFFQPHGSSGQLDNSSEIDELPPANFSSDEEPEEADQVTYISDSEDESASQTRAARPMRRVVESDSDGSATEAQSPRPSKRRSRAAISDSEDDDEGSSDAGPVRGANRRSRAIPIDSEDEDEQDGGDAPEPSRADRRRRRAVPVDSDDDEEEEELQLPSRSRKSRGRAVQDEEDEDGESDSQGGGAKTKDSGSSDDEEQSSSDDEDDDPPPPKRMSLAKRLREESRQDRSRHVDHDDSEADGMNGDGYGYSDDQEDEANKSDAELFEGEDGESEGGY